MLKLKESNFILLFFLGFVLVFQGCSGSSEDSEESLSIHASMVFQGTSSVSSSSIKPIFLTIPPHQIQGVSCAFLNATGPKILPHPSDNTSMPQAMNQFYQSLQNQSGCNYAGVISNVVYDPMPGTVANFQITVPTGELMLQLIAVVENGDPVCNLIQQGILPNDHSPEGDEAQFYELGRFHTTNLSATSSIQLNSQWSNYSHLEKLHKKVNCSNCPSIHQNAGTPSEALLNCDTSSACGSGLGGVAQSFLVASDTYVDSIKIYLKKDSAASGTSSEITLELFENTSAPDLNAPASSLDSIILESDVLSSLSVDTWTPVSIPVRRIFTSNYNYLIAIKNSAGTSNIKVRMGNTYASGVSHYYKDSSGNGWFNGYSSFTSIGNDIAFELQAACGN